MNGKHFIWATLFSAILLTVAFMPISSQQDVHSYDPWVDINDDGKIDGKDIAHASAKFGTLGTPITKASIEYDSGWIDITGKCGQYFNITHNLNATEVIVDIMGKVTLSGGEHQRYFGATDYMEGWERTYGIATPKGAHSGQNMEWAYSVIQTTDRGYAMAGLNMSVFENGFLWLVKTDPWGNMEWNVTYGGGDEVAYSVVQTDDGGYAMAGRTCSYDAKGAWLVKTHSDGFMEWNKTYEEMGAAYSLAKTPDGGYALAGSNFCLVKTDSYGNLEWNKTYGVEFDIAYSVVKTDDGGYAIAGYIESNGGDCWLVKTDSAGNVQWNKTYGGTDLEQAFSMVQTDDGGYAIAGDTYQMGALLVKTDSYGNMEWNRTYGGMGFYYASSIIQTIDGGYAMAGGWGLGAWLLKTDSAGNVLWKKAYGGSFRCVIQTDDGRYVMAGEVGSQFGDFLLVKSDAESGLMWTDSTNKTVPLYRGRTDSYWNLVRVRISKVKESP